MRISDWSSDVCSSDLPVDRPGALLRAGEINDRLAEILGPRIAFGTHRRGAAVAREPAEREPYREHGHDQDGGKNVQIGSPKTERSTNLPPARPVDKGNILAAHAVSVIAVKGDRRCVLCFSLPDCVSRRANRRRKMRAMHRPQTIWRPTIWNLPRCRRMRVPQ